jgi:hypothetical protein
MIPPKEILKWLQTELPKFTDLFSSKIAVQGAISSSNIVSINSDSHGLITGKKISISDITVKNHLESVSKTIDNSLRFNTLYNHDLTAYMKERPGRQWEAGKSVTIEGIPGVEIYNLDLTSAGVPSSKVFETDPEEDYNLPVLSGDEYLIENRSLLGSEFVVTVIDVDNFTIDLTGIPPLPDGDIILTEVVSGIRVVKTVDFERAQAWYTEKNINEAYMFLIMEDVEANKSRLVDDDGNSAALNYEKEQTIFGEFTTIVFLPTESDILGSKAQDLFYVDIFTSLLQVLYGRTFSNGEGKQDSVVDFSNHGILKYTTAFYGHGYRWQLRDLIDYTDGYINDQTVAFNEINFSQKQIDNGEMNAVVKLRE